MTSLWQSLIDAEKLASDIGDLNWFKEQYTIARETNGILESIELALDAQGLLQEYNRCLGA